MISKIDRKRIYIFVAISYAISITLAVLVYRGGGIFISYPMQMRLQAFILMALLMFAPTVAHIATRLITREGWSNTMLRPNFRRGWRFYLAGLCLPALATIAGATIFYLLFPSRFDATMTYARETWGLVPTVGKTDPLTFLITETPITILLSIISIPMMFGEEFGWRAYLLPKLMPLGGRKAVVLVGLIWAAWHWPFFPMGYNYGFDYWGAPVVGPLLYLMFVFFPSNLTAWLTLRSGSVWPTAFAHGVINAMVNWTLIFISGTPNPLIGPQPIGVIGCLGYALLGLLIFFSPRALSPYSPQPAEKVYTAAQGTMEKAIHI